MCLLGEKFVHHNGPIREYSNSYLAFHWWADSGPLLDVYWVNDLYHKVQKFLFDVYLDLNGWWAYYGPLYVCTG